MISPLQKIAVVVFTIILAADTTNSGCFKHQSARAAGLGGAFIGVGGSPAAIYDNSAGLAQLQGVSTGTTILLYSPCDGFVYSFFGINSHPTRSGLVGCLYLRDDGQDGIDRRLIEFPVLIRDAFSPPYTIDIKYMEKEGEESGFGFDLNLFYSFSPRASFGVSFENLALPEDWEGEKTWSGGLSYSWKNALLTTQWDSTLDSGFGYDRLAAGMELLGSSLALRIGGYENRAAGESCVTFGFGNPPGARLLFDYAYTRELGSSSGGSHILSIGLTR